MTALADAVLPLIRTRAELYRWGAANAHGRQMHEGIDILETALPFADPGDVYQVAHKALASAITVIARADDSSGIIGDACRRLLALHPQLSAAAHVPASRLVPWMMRFQFDGDADYFELDPVAYATALGDTGVAAYRARLEEIRAGLSPAPESPTVPDPDPDRHARWVLEWNGRRLAVLDREVDEVIRTHARDRKLAAWLHQTAQALEEIGQIDLALDWAKQAVDFDRGHQSLRASEYWYTLLAKHRPTELLDARLYVFRRWPSALTASRLHATVGTAWPNHEDEVITALASNLSDAVSFTLTTLKDPAWAWRLAHDLALNSEHTWAELVTAYERVDPVAVLPVHHRLVESTLIQTGASHYRDAARRLARMRKLAAGTDQASSVDAFIGELRETHRRRPRLQQKFDRATLP